MDNAPYHHGTMFKQTVENLKIPIVYTGPYSFDGAPIEKVFALIKYKLKRIMGENMNNPFVKK